MRAPTISSMTTRAAAGLAAGFRAGRRRAAAARGVRSRGDRRFRSRCAVLATRLRGAANDKAKLELQFRPRPLEWLSRGTTETLTASGLIATLDPHALGESDHQIKVLVVGACNHRGPCSQTRAGFCSQYA